MKKAIIVLLCVLMAAAPFLAAYAEEMTVLVQWMDASMGARTAQARLIPGADGWSYWLQLPYDADWRGLTVMIVDPSSRYTVDGNGYLLTNVSDAGRDPDNARPITFTVYLNGRANKTLSLYIASCAMPNGFRPNRQQPVDPVTVTVHYREASTGYGVASDTTVVCGEGTSAVYPSPTDLRANYTLTGEGAQYVTVTQYGADKNEITFYYTYSSPAARVVLHYRDASTGAVLAPDTEYEIDRSQTLWANPENLPDNYTLAGSGSVYVTVSGKKAYPDEYTFNYNYVPPKASAQTVPVYYLNSYNMQIAASTSVTCEEGTTRVYPSARIPAGYSLTGKGYEDVTVDRSGATPAAVYFYYTYRQPEPTATPYVYTGPVYIDVYYADNLGNQIASPNVWACVPGSNAVQPQPVDLPGGYTLLSDSVQYVTLAWDGALSDSYVVFYYRNTAVPTPSTSYKITPYEAYGFPKGDAMNFRVGPSTSSTRIKTVDRRSLGHIFGYTTDSDRNVWYAIEIGGDVGFMRQSVMELISEKEVNEYYYETRVPFNTPTPSPFSVRTPVPAVTQTPAYTPTLAPVSAEDVTDLWGYTAGKAYFRTDASRSARVIGELRQGTFVWVYSSLNMNGEIWYRVCVNSRDGYLLASDITLCAPEESETLQRAFASPMPTAVPTPEPEPVLSGFGRVNANNVYLRAKASSLSSNLGKLDMNTLVVILEEPVTNLTGTWYHVRYNDKEGYINSKYMQRLTEDELFTLLLNP